MAGRKTVLRRDQLRGMDCRGAFFLCLCFMTSQSETMDTFQEPLRCMRKLETVSRYRRPAPFPDIIRDLENSLLNASFRGNNLTLQTRSIQSLIFKLGCGFAGLSLNSTTMEEYSKAGVSHAMYFPAELTKDACRARPRELRLICIYFSTAYFFQNANSLVLNNYVLGAQLGQGHVSNLNEPISISFQHNQSLEGYMVTCVFWKEGASKHYWGVWSPEGCRTEQLSPSRVLCRCNHLSYFAVLMQLSQAPIPRELLVPLMYISLVGCSISIVSSLLTILLHFQARKQGDSMTRIHMNLHASVLLLNVTFLLSPLPATPPVPGSACTAVAAILHFALLSCLTWTAIEGFNLYLLLGHVYNIYIRRYLLKLCAVGWGVPALLVLLLVVESSAYGPCTIPVSSSQENGTGFQNMSMFLPLPVVLLPEAPLRGRDGDRDGEVQLLPDDAVVCASSPRRPPLSGRLQPEALGSPREGGRPAAGHQGPLWPPGRLFYLRGFPRPRGQCAALPPLVSWGWEGRASFLDS
ncbi:adhesion G-protein coupled receptor G5 isoform X5 [Mustela lutreola]|uniref:adhesion G-protein coupled receptor G5 isoform X5 n=1 Tax=Mustela lutreola TaxID=9666 RepID=UPI002797BED7|nr:adhesion G-protein coupled receptor G5 isoform X5 [Mustela lutreola]